MKIFLFILALLTNNAFAGIPSEYQAITVQPPFSFSQRVFDITSAVNKAKEEKKNLLIYLGAQDCPPCKTYENFLKENFTSLKDDFKKVIFLELDTYLKGPQIVIRVDGKDQNIKDFFLSAGQEKFILRYPSFWLLSPDLKIVKNLQRGITGLTTVEATKAMLK